VLATPPGGAAPLTVRFSLATRIVTAGVEADFDGDGSVDFRGPALEGQAFTYPDPGVYLARVTVADDQGVPHAATAIVEAHDLVALDAALQAKWAAFKASLRQGNVEDALQLVALDDRDAYRDMLNGLTVPLASIDTVLRDLSLVALGDGRAEYHMARAEGGVTLSHLVVFIRDDDGIWRLEFF
jgi:hypothetical protein